VETTGSTTKKKYSFVVLTALDRRRESWRKYTSMQGECCRTHLLTNHLMHPPTTQKLCNSISSNLTLAASVSQTTWAHSIPAAHT
jgi:hypothetical protein